MKKSTMKICAVACILSAMLSQSIALAHPGRTDKNGGHTNRKTGEYHYHNGGSGGSGGSSTKTSKPTSKPKATPKPATAKPLPSKITTKINANLHNDADKTSTVLATIPEGTVLSVLGQTNYFYKVVFDKKMGYVRKVDVK